MSGRPLVQTRVSPALRDAIDAAAARDGTDRGDYIRRALTYAVASMPPLGDDTGQEAITPTADTVAARADRRDRTRRAGESDAEYLERVLGKGWRTDFPGFDA